MIHRIRSLLAIVVIALFAATQHAHADVNSDYAYHKVLNSQFQVSVHWTLDTSNKLLHVAIQALASASNYVALGFSSDGQMSGSTAILGSSPNNVFAYNLASQSQSGVTRFSVDPLANKSVTVANGFVTVASSFNYSTNVFPTFNVNANQHVLWAIGPVSNTFPQHHDNKDSATVNFSLPSYICSPVCQNGGICTASNTCNCVNGYRGAQCQTVPSSDPLADAYQFNTQIGAVKVYWTPNVTSGTIDFAAKASYTGYIGVGFSPNGLMIGSNAVIGYVDSNGYSVAHYNLTDKDGTAIRNTKMNDLTNANASESNGVTTMFFTFAVAKSGVPINFAQNVYLIVAVSNSDQFATHSSNGAASVNLLTGSSSVLGKPKEWTNHGWLMTFAWGIIVPIAVHIARYEKGRKSILCLEGEKPDCRGNKQPDPWFTFHQYLQTVALILSIAGFAVIVDYVSSVKGSHFAFGHAVLGLIIFILGLIQGLGGYFRIHKGKPYRAAWEILHRNSGRVAAILAFVNIFLGLKKYEGTESYIIAFAVWLAFIFAISIFREIRRMMGNQPTNQGAEELK